MEDLLATIFLAAMAVLVVAGIYLYQGLQLSEPGATSEPAAKLVTIAAKP
ncbi:MAG: hypothetical protein ABIQ73_00010 [Acidimicrobiales bacterium]